MNVLLRLVMLCISFVPASVAQHSAAPSTAEGAAIAQIVRRGLAEASHDFARIRGRRVATGTYAVTEPLGKGLLTCHIAETSSGAGSRWELICRSRPHPEPTEKLSPLVKRTISANIPKILNHFSQDDDSIGDLTLGWEHSYSYPLAVYARVSSIWLPEHDATGSYSVAHGSYYELHIESSIRPS